MEDYRTMLKHNDRATVTNVEICGSADDRIERPHNVDGLRRFGVEGYLDEVRFHSCWNHYSDM